MNNLKMKENNSIYNNMQKNKNSGIHLTNEVQNIYSSNYKIWLNEIL
jgi:hypothetical protein